MAKVVTLTPNPALDIATHVEQLVPSHKLRCGQVRRDPGGGGINVARVVHRLGGRAIAVYASGGGSGDELRTLLRAEGLDERAVPVAGHTRESFNITEDQSNRQYRFVLPGDSLSEPEWKNCLEVTLSLLAEGDYLVASGSLPPGVPAEFYARLFQAAKAKNAITVVDTHGPPLKAALDEGVGILKASGREFAEFLGIAAPLDLSGWSKAGLKLVQSGRAGTVAITLGEQGAVMVTSAAALHVSVPNVPSRTTVGAGDSFLGGLLVKVVDEKPWTEALQFAAAAGTAALLAHGTALCDPEEVAKLNATLTVTPL